MTKTKKALVIAGVIFSLMVVLLPVEGCLIYRFINRIHFSEQDIIDYVTENETDLKRYVDGEIAEKALMERIGETTVKSIQRDENGTVVFQCDYQGGAVAPSTEVGFLYSESDIPSFEDIGPSEFREKEEGKYLAEFSRGNTVEANRILPGWFYYRVNWH